MGTSLEYDGLQTTSIEETCHLKRQPSYTAVTGILKLVSAHPKQVSKTDEGSIESSCTYWHNWHNWTIILYFPK